MPLLTCRSSLLLSSLPSSSFPILQRASRTSAPIRSLFKPKVIHAFDTNVLETDLEAIEQARSFVKISTYLLELSTNSSAKAAAYRLGEALKKAKANGALIQITFSNDALTASPRPYHQETVAYLNKELGLPDLTSATPGNRIGKSGYVIRSLHSKNIVTESYVRAGSTNLNMNGYTYNLEDTIQIKNITRDRDGQTIHDAMVKYADELFVNKQTVNITTLNRYFNFITGTKEYFWQPVLDRLRSNSCTLAYFSTYTYNLTNTTIQEVVQAMIDAKKRGVDVRLVADKTARGLVDYLNSKTGSTTTTTTMMAKVISSPNGGINHSKIIYMEDAALGNLLIISSQNFDAAGSWNSGFILDNAPIYSYLYTLYRSAYKRYNYLWSL
ncbi:MAG: phospholipase D-like domain-containing protein [Candidatus Nitrosocaldaceae archaeon]